MADLNSCDSVVGGPTSMPLKIAEMIVDLAGDVTVGVSSLADPAGDVTVGVSSLADLAGDVTVGVSSPADLAGGDTIGVAPSAVAEVACSADVFDYDDYFYDGHYVANVGLVSLYRRGL